MKKSIELPDDIAAAAEKAAKAELRSFSGYVAKVLADRLGWKPDAEEQEEPAEVAP